MNILIPHSWLLEHLDTQASPQDIQKIVSLSGPSIERIYDREGESVYDIEVTTNRVDSMSVRGIAREAAVILQQAGISAKLKPLNITQPIQSGESLPLPNIVNNPDLSKRIACIILKDVQRTPTPDWMAKRLKQIEQNVHDSVIDITNYITHELGHPCHAFDYDKIMALGGTIIVTVAEAGKKFITLDGNEFETIGGEVTFENGNGDIIDLPAIKGTKNTSIDDSTKNVLLWIETLDAKKVRFASMTHAIRTVAAQLSEKNVDPELGYLVVQRGAELYQQLCQASIASELHDEFPGKKNPAEVSLPLSTIDTYLGVQLDAQKIESILQQLECQVSWNPGQSRAEIILKVIPPTFRPDMTIPADIVEEIARIYGYHNLPSVLMPTSIPTNRPTDTNFTLENRIKQFLADIGWQEVYTYSMVSEQIAAQSGLQPDQHLKLQNPLTDDRVYLRRTLVPSLLEVLDSNPQRPQLSVFELAYIYNPRENQLPEQIHHLTMISQLSYRQTRGVLESLLRQFFITDIQIKPTSEKDADIIIEQETIGTITVLSNQRISVDIEMSVLLPHLNTHPSYQPLPKAEGIIEDLTFTLPEKTPIGNVIESINSCDPLIKKVELGAIYEQNYSFTVSYLDPEKSISNDQVEPIRKHIVTTVQNQFGAELIGKV